MKTGLSLTEMACELERQSKSKKDFLADTRKLSLRPSAEGGVVMEGVNGGMRLRPTAHQQLAETLGIPKPYYDRMMVEAPDLLATNANRWLVKAAKKLVRTIDGEVRAILSDGYRPLDNFDLAQAALPVFMKMEAQVLSTQITENRFYMKAVSPRVEGSPKPGDRIQAGAVVSNSEVGQGKIRVEELDYRLVCLNGMVRASLIAKTHVGRGRRGGEDLEDSREYFKTETRAADDKAFFLKVADVVEAAFSQERFNARLLEYQTAAEREIVADPVEVVEVTSKRFGLTDGEREGVLQSLIRGGDLSQWGLANAFTQYAQKVDSYDRSTELEAVGGRVIELSQTDWKHLAV